MFSIVEFGAKDDRQFNSRTAILAAVDACAEAGGGTVCVPAGDFLSGTLQLKSHVTRCLDAGATLWASTNASDYTETNDYENAGRFRVGALLLARDANCIGREGMVHPRTGSNRLWCAMGCHRDPAVPHGDLFLNNCRHAAIRGVTILFSDA